MQWSFQWKVWVKMKRSSHSNEEFGVHRQRSTPRPANSQKQPLKKGAVTMVLVQTLQVWPELLLKAWRSVYPDGF